MFGFPVKLKLKWVTLREKCPYSELFWSVFSRIWTEYGEILRISHFQSKCGKIRTRKTPNTGTFYAVLRLVFGDLFIEKSLSEAKWIMEGKNIFHWKPYEIEQITEMHLTVNYSPQKVPSNIMRLRIVLLFIRNFNGFYGFYAFCGLSHLDGQDYY